ncbi:hypothetical protein O3M35_007976 [Rhynocoris fuscipes]|uniref:RRM domain-containing protein n=1 Tax=Rhynocoris fuscipes TaxID=488301 RepID=A0AAW1DB88_9HEMI
MAASENRTLFVGNLSERVTEEILFELFLQAGPLESVRIPTTNGRRRTYGFVEYKHEVSVPYAARLFYQTTLYGRMLQLQLPKGLGRRGPGEMMLNILPNSLKSRLGPPIKHNNYNYTKSSSSSSSSCSPSQVSQAINSASTAKLPSSLPLQIPATAAANRSNNLFMQHKRMPSHLLPSPAKKRIRDQVIERNIIPDSLDLRGIMSGKSNNNAADDTKKKFEKTSDDLRSKIKKKKKKKNKEHSKKPNSTPERLTTTTTTTTTTNSSSAANRGI